MDSGRDENYRGSRKHSLARHSSPLPLSEDLQEMSLSSQLGEIYPELEKYGKSFINRRSNNSDLDVQDQNLHTDSGISSSDSLPGCEKRLAGSLIKQDAYSDDRKPRDDSMMDLEDNEALRDYEDITGEKPVLRKTMKQLNNDCYKEADTTLDCNPPTTIFMTALGSDIATIESPDLLQSAWAVREDNDRISRISTGLYDARMYCSICGCLFTDPRLLPCLHTFCLTCLESSLHVRSDDTASSAGDILSCPTCQNEVNLPLEGVYSFPVNQLIQRLVLLEKFKLGMMQSFTCDLCPDDSSVEGRCVQCQANLCSFCCMAHKRQSLTSTHTVLTRDAKENDDTGDYYQPKSLPMICQRHTAEELTLYCIDCSQLVCRDCCLSSKHKDHRCEYSNLVYNQEMSEIQEQLRICEPKVEALRDALIVIEQSRKVVQDTADEVAGKVYRHIASYIAALEKHRDILLSIIKERSDSELKSIQLQHGQHVKILNDISSACELTSMLLGLGSHSEVLSVKQTILKRLQHFSALNYARVPRPVENFVEFRANKMVKVWIAGDMDSCLSENKRSSRLLRPGLEIDVCGDIVTHAVEPKYCTAHGEGIRSCRLKLPSEFIVIAKNCKREQLESGGSDVSVRLDLEGMENFSFRKPKVQVSDRQDGTYRVLYIVYTTGNYRLSVHVYGEHIHGSPFIVNATEYRPLRHSGIFHCCCFCSSGGDKAATCACGSTMPGGFSGCGHGHEGHPGSAHWSCCGEMLESSSCHKQPSAAQDCDSGLDRNSGEALPVPVSVRRNYTLPARSDVSRNVDHLQSADHAMYPASTLRSQTTMPRVFSKGNKEVRTVSV